MSHMSEDSRKSVLLAARADIVGSGNRWKIILTTSMDRSAIKDGKGELAVYPSSRAAVQAIRRVRPDLRWIVTDTRPNQSESQQEHSTPIERHKKEKIKDVAVPSQAVQESMPSGKEQESQSATDANLEQPRVPEFAKATQAFTVTYRGNFVEWCTVVCEREERRLDEGGT